MCSTETRPGPPTLALRSRVNPGVGLTEPLVKCLWGSLDAIGVSVADGVGAGAGRASTVAIDNARLQPAPMLRCSEPGPFECVFMCESEWPFWVNLCGPQVGRAYLGVSREWCLKAACGPSPPNPLASPSNRDQTGMRACALAGAELTLLQPGWLHAYGLSLECVRWCVTRCERFWNRLPQWPQPN